MERSTRWPVSCFSSITSLNESKIQRFKSKFSEIEFEILVCSNLTRNRREEICTATSLCMKSEEEEEANKVGL